jgi:hypothetical protein
MRSHITFQNIFRIPTWSKWKITHLFVFKTIPTNTAVIFQFVSENIVVGSGFRSEDLNIKQVYSTVIIQIPINKYFTSEYEFEFPSSKNAETFVTKFYKENFYMF